MRIGWWHDWRWNEYMSFTFCKAQVIRNAYYVGVYVTLLGVTGWISWNGNNNPWSTR